jgi:mannose/fructose/N-acetylgalactosamine-specific phosphotransferase system component IID
MSKVSRTQLFKIAARLSLLQSTWFEGGMQAIGLCYCLIPGLRAIYSNSDDLKAALLRYQAPFNTHPFMAGIIVGMLLRMEEEKTPPSDISTFARNAMGLLAALADPFFKSALPTFVCVIACLTAMVGGAIAGIVTIVIAFNAIHLAVRFMGVSLGYTEGMNVLKRVAGWISPMRTAKLKRASAVGAGVVLSFFAIRFGSPISQQLLLSIVAAASAIAAAYVLTIWRKPARLVIPVTLAAVVLVEVIL